jgi:uncharacterized damage-inducible protein DinB
MNPETARTVAEFLLGSLEHELKTTTAVLAAVPAGRHEYCPDPKAKTALGLVRHITLEDEWLLNVVADGRFSPPPDDSDACGIRTSEDAVKRYNERIPAAIARVRALSGEALARPIDFFGNTVPAVVVLGVMAKHSVHHRGQLSTYLRPMGSRIPPIYGPSADTEMATT